MTVKILTFLSWMCAAASVVFAIEGKHDEAGYALLMAIYIDGRLYLYK